MEAIKNLRIIAPQVVSDDSFTTKLRDGGALLIFNQGFKSRVILRVGFSSWG